MDADGTTGSWKGGREQLSEGHIESSGTVSVLFKADTAANHSGWDMDKSWSTYLKIEPQPPNTGRVLRFEAKGIGPRGEKQVLELLPFNRIVDQRYAVYFNITGS
jgi:hypothetical protein